MKNLGNLEETVLLLVMIMEEPYGYAIADEYRDQTGQQISISAIHTVLMRLEKKGLLTSKMEGSTESRGGRRKRVCEVTGLGRSVIQSLKENRMKLWSQIQGI
ncbi:PadR family transcriptional regulator [Roseivirga sp.]|uniref:PadR family transcriptional regulator n=1 Tax=Roseivirga sp. TaxID=1964215 RepID=UPI003B8D51D2